MDQQVSTRLVSSSSQPNSASSSSPTSSSSSSSFLKYFKKKNGNNNGSNSTETSMKDNEGCTFTVGVSEDKNRKCRRTMEDAHTYVYNFGGQPDDGYFAVFDGHAGRQAAEWCSKKMHTLVESMISKPEHKTVCHAMNGAFLTADSKMNEDGLKNSGCTAAVAVIRWEDSVGSGGSNENELSRSAKRRCLYVANVGDTRVILCRNGKPLRLSYDHKGSDVHETKRILNSGGIVVNNRVNGVLAVTRSLGDNYMKQLVSGSPYTTETEILPQDEFIIVACDGLWDVCSDEVAVDLIRNEKDPKVASQQLVDYALEHFSSDNLTCMVIRLEE